MNILSRIILIPALIIPAVMSACSFGDDSGLPAGGSVPQIIFDTDECTYTTAGSRC